MNIRRGIAWCIAGIVAAAALIVAAFFLGIFPGKTIPVLMYHHITPRIAMMPLEVSHDNFQRQMQYLQKHHYEVIGPERLLTSIRSKQKPAKQVMITLDDGYEDNYTHALPVLEQCGFKATFFIVHNWVGTMGHMNWDQIRDLLRRGHTIGSHSLTHPMLTEIDLAQAKQEVYNSKHLIEKDLGAKINFFCYPTGRFDPLIRRMVQEAGYEAAFATAPGRAYDTKDIFALKRIRVSDRCDNTLQMWWRVAGYYLLLRERTARRLISARGYN